MGYILFSAKGNVSISAFHRWNGVMEYSYNNKVWNIWSGETIINNKIYMRGINNTVVSYGLRWVIDGENVKCQGNIENLLDYKSVINNVHPKMDKYCFARMFVCCQALIECPQLSSVNLVSHCYDSMFCGCKLLLRAPQMIFSTTAESCCYNMFADCVSLTNMPLLVYDDLSPKCFANMFEDCLNLEKVVALSNVKLEEDCYYHMFVGCDKITITPSFPNAIIAKQVFVSICFTIVLR